MEKSKFAEVVEELQYAVALEYKGIVFECWNVDEEYENVWGEICECCVGKYMDVLKDELDPGGCGACSVKGCDVVGDDSDYERHYYIDFELEHIRPLGLEELMEKHPHLVAVDERLMDARVKLNESEKMMGPNRDSWEPFR